MSKRRGGSLPRVMPTRRPSGLGIRMAIPGLPITAPDPLAVSLGGSETAGLQLAAELVRQGHRVTVACNTPEPFAWRGVKLQGGFDEPDLSKPYDLFLVQRAPEILRSRGAARAAFLWVHDLLDPGHAGPLTALAPLADRIVTVSRWQMEQYRALAPGLAGDRFLVARNGIDLDLIAEATAGVERDPYRIVYTTRPERGLEVLLKAILPPLLNADERASLHLAAYEAPVANASLAGYYEHLGAIAARYAGRVVWHDGLGKRDLYRLMAGSGLFLYPTPAPRGSTFAETSCITAMEAMACGLPWISTDRGALPETVGDDGVLVPLKGASHAGEPAVVEGLVEEALRVLRDPSHANRLRAAGLARAKSLSWAPVAEQITAEAVAVTRVRRTAPAPAIVRATPPAARLAIATPCYGQMVHGSFAQSLAMTVADLGSAGAPVVWLTISSSLIRLARNRLAAMFLARQELTHLLWVDADISWHPSDVLRLLAHDVEIVGGIYPKKTLEMEFVAQAAFDEEGTVAERASGAFEVSGIGSGFLLVRREAYLRMIAAFPERAIPDAAPPNAQRARPWLYDLYPEGIENGRMFGEDLGFCRLWRAIGGKIWADPTIRLTHHGMHGFTGDPMKLFATVPQVGEAA